MSVELDALLQRYESGQISRRQLLGALAAALASGCAPAAPEAGIGVAKQLNHVTLFVRSVEESQRFYQDLFSMPILTPQPPGVNLRVGGGFVGLYPAGEEPNRIHHVCLGLEGFDADTTLDKLVARGIEASVRSRDETKELYLVDPNGIVIQLQDVRYRGGVGPLGDRDPG